MSAIGNHFYAAHAIRIAADHVGIEPETITGRSREPHVCEVRWAIMLAMHQRGMSSLAIGRRLNRDHTTILNGLKRAKKLASDAHFSTLLEALA